MSNVQGDKAKKWSCGVGEGNNDARRVDRRKGKAKKGNDESRT